MEKYSLKTVLERLLKSPNIASREPIYETYDKNIQGNTVWERGDAACSMTACFRDFPELKDEKANIAVSVTGGGNPNLAKIDPKVAAENAVMEAVFTQSCVGGVSLAATDCLNFGNPEKEDQMGELVVGIEGVKRACEALDVPIVSGNVSLYNESAGKSIPPSAIISVFGRVDDVKKVKPVAFSKKSSIFIIGKRSENLGGSEFLRVLEKEDSRFPTIDYDYFAEINTKVRTLVLDSRVDSISPIIRGGAIVAILKAAFKGGVGVDLTLSEDQVLGSFFSENIGAVATTTDPQKIKDLLGEEAIEIGKTTEARRLKISQGGRVILSQDLAEWERVWRNTLRSIF